MGPDDVGAPIQRDMGVHVTRGTEPWRIFAQYMAAPTVRRGRDSNVHIADMRLGLIAMVSHLPAMMPVAVGGALAWGSAEPRVALAGRATAPGRGDAHEAMNLAGVHRLPVVFIVDNNQFAYSTPDQLEFACDHMADRAAGYGFEGVVVDGTDVLAVHREAKARDREGAGRRRADAARAGDAAGRGPRGPRRRVLRAAGLHEAWRRPIRSSATGAG